MATTPAEYQEAARKTNMFGGMIIGLLERWQGGKVTDAQLADGITYLMNAAEASNIVGDGYNIMVEVVRPKPAQVITIRRLNGEAVFAVTTPIEE